MLVLASHVAHASVAIEEIMYDVSGADTGREWIEVFNTSAESVDLVTWKFFEDGANHGIADAGGGTMLAAGARAIIVDNPAKFMLDWPAFAGLLLDSAFSLSNTGETLALKDATGTIVESVTYASSQGAAGTGESLAKRSTGWGAGVPTPAEANEGMEEEILPDEQPTEELPTSEALSEEPQTELPVDSPAEEPASEEIPPESDSDSPSISTGIANVTFNEIMYDAPGADTDQEWIELYNGGDGAADLLDWRFHEQDTDHRLVFLSQISVINAGGYAVIVSDEVNFRTTYPEYTGTLFKSSFSLSNVGEEIILKDPSLLIMDTLVYPAELGAGGDGSTLAKIDSAWQVGSATPGSVNMPAVEEVRSLVGGGASEEASVFFEDTLTEANVVRTDISIPVPEPLSTEEQAMLSISTIEYEKYFYPLITNTGDIDLDISGMLLVSGEKSFTLPVHTIVSAGRTLAIGTKKARSGEQTFSIAYPDNLASLLQA